MENKKKLQKISDLSYDNFAQRIKLSGKVKYKIYSEYLNHLSKDELQVLFIEESTELEKIRNINKKVTFTILSAIIVSIGAILFSSKISDNIGKLTQLNEYDKNLLSFYISLFLISIALICVMLIIIVYTLEANRTRKVKFIEKEIENRK